jgi:2-alkyl-3-oxoalkanoate reductase
MKAFLTGGTGLLGSHIAEQLMSRGDRVLALARPGSDCRFLESTGAVLVQGTLDEAVSWGRALKGCDVVFHAAARVSDWGPWTEFQRDTIDATRNLLQAMIAAGVPRLVYISSVAVYGYRAHLGGVWSEDCPYAARFLLGERYAPAKIATEKLVFEYHRAGKLQAAVIRPGWIYGPRDRASLPRLIKLLRAGRARIVGSGDNRLHLVYAGNVAGCCIVAAEKEAALGKAFNVSNDCQTTQRDYINRVAQALDFRPVTKSIPTFLAMKLAALMEFSALLLRRTEPPPITRQGLYIINNRAVYDSSRARAELGWRPAIGFDEGLQRTIRWLRSVESNMS